jgi:phage shock protein A
MTILAKLKTLFRANLRETAEQLTDANAIRIYRQEIVDAQNLLCRRKLGLAAMIANRKELEHEINVANKGIEKLEQKIAKVPATERTDELLLMAAADIADAENHVEHLSKRHIEVKQRINTEEIKLRKLVAEIREHSREVKILQSQVASTKTGSQQSYENTVSAQLATLRDTRTSLSGAASANDTAEASMEEMIERVEDSAIDRKLENIARSDQDLRINSVLSRLKNIGEAGQLPG